MSNIGVVAYKGASSEAPPLDPLFWDDTGSGRPLVALVTGDGLQLRDE